MAETKERKEIPDPLFSDPAFKKALTLTLLECPHVYYSFILYLSGLKNQEIATRRGLAINTIEYHLIQAKEIFLRHIETLLEERLTIVGKYIRKTDLFNAVGKFPACD